MRGWIVGGTGAVGATGAMLLALNQKQLTIKTLRSVVYQSAQVSAMVFMILIGASLFSLVLILLLRESPMIITEQDRVTGVTREGGLQS